LFLQFCVVKEIKQRPGDAVGSALDIVGDKWSLMIIWNMIMHGKNTYNELLKSNEGIATNILASRLAKLEAAGLLTKETHPDSKAKILYRLTHKGIDLLPALVELMLWAHAYLPVHPAADAYTKLLKQNKETFVKRIVEDMKKKL
jgi:DNA-binding HxlR family transcriptional regulator